MKEVKAIQNEKGISSEYSVKNPCYYFFSWMKSLIFAKFPGLRWRIIKLKHHLFNPEEEKLYAEYLERARKVDTH